MKVTPNRIKTKIAAYRYTPHRTIDQLIATARHRVLNGELAGDVVQDIVDGYDLGWGSANCREIEAEARDADAEYEERCIALGFSGSSEAREHGEWLDRRGGDATGMPREVPKNTPAPWEPMTAGGKQYVVGGPDQNNGVAYICGVTPENITANARLIAAAPELLEALETILEWMETAHSAEAMAPGGWPMIDAARAALTKATTP